MKTRLYLSGLVAIAIVTAGSSGRLAAQSAPDPHSVPSVDGGIGACSVLFTIRDAKDAPIYNAKVRVHIAYGFLSARKLDLEVGSNIDGKAKVTGLPRKVKFPLEFEASEGDRSGSAVIDPAENCRTEKTIVLLKATGNPATP